MNDHYHCWEQKQPPACGLKGEHLRCCLCPAHQPSTMNTNPTYNGSLCTSACGNDYDCPHEEAFEDEQNV